MKTFYAVLFSMLAFGFANAQCGFSNLEITTSDCNDANQVNAIIDFDFVGQGNDGFTVQGNGTNYGNFSYEDLPITIENINANCELEYEFIIKDIQVPDCIIFSDFGTICCENNCSLSINDFEVGECNDDMFFVQFFANAQSTSGDSIVVTSGDDFFGTYPLNEGLVTVEGIDLGESFLATLEICVQGNENCCETISFENPCQCIFNITTEVVECSSSDSTYYAVINFDANVSSDSFLIGNSDNFLGTFAYADLPVTVGPLSFDDDEKEILIVDSGNFFCFNSAFLGIVNDCDIQCQLYNTFAEATQCEDNEYYIDFEFDGEDVVGSTFFVEIGGEAFGPYAYGQSFYSAGPIPSNCGEAPTLFVIDASDELCSDFYNFPEPICCADCFFSDVSLEVICDDASVFLEYSFVNAGVTNDDTYQIVINDLVFGPFEYGDDPEPLDLGALSDGEYLFTISDNGDENCFAEEEFFINCNEVPCGLFDLTAEAVECGDEFFYVSIDFQSGGAIADSFIVRGNGVVYGTFPYGQAPYIVGPIGIECDKNFEIIVIDQQNDDCRDAVELGSNVCCDGECDIRDMVVTQVECNDFETVIGFYLNFIYENVSDSFDLTIGDIYYGTYAYEDLPLLVEGAFTPGSYQLTVTDSEFEDCGEEINSLLICGGSNCDIRDITYTILECNEDPGIYSIELDFIHENNTDSFYIVFNDFVLEFFAYDNLPLTIDGLELGVEYQWIITDANLPECFEPYSIFQEICESSVYEEDLQVDVFWNNDIVRINNESNTSYQLRLIGIDGRSYSANTVSEGQMKDIPLIGLAKGVYILTIEGEDRFKTYKIVHY